MKRENGRDGRRKGKMGIRGWGGRTVAETEARAGQSRTVKRGNGGDGRRKEEDGNKGVGWEEQRRAGKGDEQSTVFCA